MTRSWGVVVPVKRLAVAKTRLSSYGDQARQDLALAFAADVVASALQVARVLVVTDDERATAELSALGAEVAADDPDAGLNPALEHGTELLRRHDPALGVAAVSADLPAMRPGHLREALAQVTRRSFVRDLDGTGTTLLAAAQGISLGAAFGPRSQADHLASGAVELVAARGLRCDVDTPSGLLTALALGAGPRTARAAAGLGISVVAATVRAWDERGGSAHRDGGERVDLPPDALRDSGIRFLRTGQRIRVALAADGQARVSLP